jgi:hypothetical protein
MRSMAGFSPSTQGNFYLPRAKTLPPQSLEQTVWPFVDEWLAWFDAEANGAGDDDHVKSEDEADRQDLAAQGFLRLLKQLRIILLQDSVIMRREFPTHPIWTDPVFRRDDHQAFTRDVEPEEVQIRKTLPAIAEHISVLHQSLARDLNEWGAQTKERLDNIETRLGDLFGGRVSMTLNASHRVAAPGGATPASMTTATAFHSILTSPRDGGPLSPSASSPPSSSSYVLSRTVSTVPQLWREWTVGLGNGLSVQGLEDLYGPRWRPAHSEKMMYSRRKVIIDEMRRRRRQAEGINTGTAVEEVELMRQRGRLSLHQQHQLLNRQKRSAQQ